MPELEASLQHEARVEPGLEKSSSPLSWVHPLPALRIKKDSRPTTDSNHVVSPPVPYSSLRYLALSQRRTDRRPCVLKHGLQDAPGTYWLAPIG